VWWRRVWLDLVIATVVIVFAVPVLREQAVDQARRLWLRRSLQPFVLAAADPGERESKLAESIAKRYPDDAEALLGAGVMALSAGGFASNPQWPEPKRMRKLALPHLERAAKLSDSPAAWAAYCYALLPDLRYERIGTSGADPEDSKAVAEETSRLAAEEPRQRLTEGEAKAALKALKSWQQADPQNGLPVALEAYVLYGLQRDAEALLRWMDASRLPLASTHSEAMRRVEVRALDRIGISPYEALFTTTDACRVSRYLRDASRMAVYEGRLARLQGRDDDALRLWQATVELGRRLQAGSSSTLDLISAKFVKSIGASPAWVWVADKRTGTHGGPFREGRYWYGRQHGFHVKEVGAQADAALRDELLADSARDKLVLSASSQVFDAMVWAAGYMVLDYGGTFVGLMLTALLAVFGVVSAFGVESADAAAPARLDVRRTGWKRLLLALSPLIAVEAVGIALSQFAPEKESTGTHILYVAVAGVLATSVSVALFVKQGAVSAWDAWRGIIRAGVRGMAPVLALAYLAAGIGMASIGHRVDAYISQPEVARAAQHSGSRWMHPSIPPDAWRAAFPPKVARDGG
jgi:hypothetical protein